MALPRTPTKNERSLTSIFLTGQSTTSIGYWLEFDAGSWLGLSVDKHYAWDLFVSPFQGYLMCRHHTQGVALGWCVLPLRGGKANGYAVLNQGVTVYGAKRNGNEIALD